MFAYCEQEMVSLSDCIVSRADSVVLQNNVERIQYYMDLETEAAAIEPSDPKADEMWPTAGKVLFEGVQLQYRPDLPLVLKGLIKINAGEKIGIIGRTGAGKSSIAQALFRTVELYSGRILIDDLDLKHLGLETVRLNTSDRPELTALHLASLTSCCDSPR